MQRSRFFDGRWKTRPLRDRPEQQIVVWSIGPVGRNVKAEGAVRIRQARHRRCELPTCCGQEGIRRRVLRRKNIPTSNRARRRHPGTAHADRRVVRRLPALSTQADAGCEDCFDPAVPTATSTNATDRKRRRSIASSRPATRSFLPGWRPKAHPRRISSSRSSTTT